MDLYGSKDAWIQYSHWNSIKKIISKHGEPSPEKILGKASKVATTETNNACSSKTHSST